MDKAGQHGEPWRAHKGSKFRTDIMTRNDTVIGAVTPHKAARAIACVNALASLSDEQLSQDPIGKAREALDAICRASFPDRMTAARMRIAMGLINDMAKDALALLGDKP